ncbi:MAG: inositol monophosphatase family protein [Chloroflexota bacterium]
MDKELLTFTQHLADISGDVIRKYYRGDIQLDTKSDDTPVTIADRQAEEVMREAIMKEYPTHGIVGEEMANHLPDAEYQWVLDPIDGTKNFVAGSYLFGTLIALLKAGQPIWGVIHQPVVRDFLVGDGQQTLLNGKRVQIDPIDRIEDAVMQTTEHWAVFKYQNGPAFEAFSKRVKRYNTWGDCHAYYLVATGGSHVALDPIMNPWDLLPMIPIINGAGGRITDWYGGDPVKGESIIATSGSIHDEVVRLLNPVG